LTKSLHTLLVFCLFCSKVFGQYSFLGADAYGRANSLVAVSTFSSVYHNPGGVGSLDHSFISVGYLRTLPIEGLHTVGAQGVYVNKALNIGFTADSFGDKYYRESRLGAILAKKMDKVSVGLKMSYLGVNIDELSSRNTLLGEAGMMVTPNRFFSLGLHLINFTGARLYGDVNLPTVVAFGLAINPSDKINISSQVDYILDHKPKLRLGLNYKIRDELALSSGINPEMRSVHFGANVLVKRYGFFYAVATHPNVGLAHNLSLIFKFNE
jgi:hypothetical protein